MVRINKQLSLKKLNLIQLTFLFSKLRIMYLQRETMQHFAHLKQFQLFMKPIIRIHLVCFSHFNLKSNKLVCKRTMNETCSLKDLSSHLGKSTPTTFINLQLTLWNFLNSTFRDTLRDMLTRQIYLNSIKKSRDIRSSNMLWEKFPF